MEVYRTANNEVAKYVHDDGSETAIKSVSTCIDDNFSLGEQARKKYAVFISSSVGCPVKCKFCYLTTKGCPYHKLKAQEIYNNVKGALESEMEYNPGLKGKYIKISWMGMGDAFFSMDAVYSVTDSLIKWVIKNEYALGIDGVDIGTTLPIWGSHFPIALGKLQYNLGKYKRNPFITDGRSLVRIFYSLHATDDEKREEFIPKSYPLKKSLAILSDLYYNQQINIILHHVFLKGINDTTKDIIDLINFCSKCNNYELRVLRFNQCPNTRYEETDKYEYIIDTLKSRIPKLKFQVSVGSEILSACGQFLLINLGDNNVIDIEQ